MKLFSYFVLFCYYITVKDKHIQRVGLVIGVRNFKTSTMNFKYLVLTTKFNILQKLNNLNHKYFAYRS